MRIHKHIKPKTFTHIFDSFLYFHLNITKHFKVFLTGIQQSVLLITDGSFFQVKYIWDHSQIQTQSL